MQNKDASARIGPWHVASHPLDCQFADETVRSVVFGNASLAERLMVLVPLVLSLTVHEWAHAWSASRLGDDTAAREGRLTLNPLPHIDPIGTLLLPLLGIPFGWARPVPVNPARFRRGISMRGGMVITAVAGPISNLVLATLAAIAYGLAFRINPTFLKSGMDQFLGIAIQMNVGLAIFNMLPVPPLDGSRLLEYFVPDRWRPSWESFARISGFVLLGVLVFGQGFLFVPIAHTVSVFQQLILYVAGLGA